MFIEKLKFPGVETQKKIILLIHFMHLPSSPLCVEFIFPESVDIKKNVKTPWVFMLNQVLQFFSRSTSHNKMRKILRKFFNPASIYLLEVNTRNTIKSCEICSKLTIKIPERRNWRCSGIFIVNFEHISQLLLAFLSLTLNM